MTAGRESCSGAWEASTGPVLAASLSAESCEFVTGTTLALPTCRAVAEKPSACSVACAEVWMPVAAMCAGQPAALETAAPGLSQLCTAAIAPVLATAPSSLTVTGLACHPAANTLFLLEPASRNARPHYKSESGTWQLYWSASYGNTGGPAWIIDFDLDAEHAPVYLIEPGHSAPAGDASWREWCDSSWAETPLTVAASRPDDAWCSSSLAALSGGLTTQCCRPEDGETCGQDGEPPGVCTIDCA